jgi:ribose transport system permease protein
MNHSDRLPPALGENASASILRSLVPAASIVVGYVIFAGLIWLFDRLGSDLELGWLRMAGLFVDAILLTVVVVYLGRRAHPAASMVGPLLALLVVILFFSYADWWMHGERASFWSLRNLRTIAVQTSTVAVAALGMTMIIISGGIDLSAGTTLALCATVLAYCLDEKLGIATAMIACVVTGCLAGMMNGGLISLLRVVPFIITLGTMTIYLGLAKYIAKETTVRPPLDEIPAWLPALVTPRPHWEWLVRPLVPNFASGVWLALVLALLLGAMLHLTVFGRHIFALGSNESTARLCGINVSLTKTAVYALAGLFVGVAGMYQFARLSTGNPTSGIGLELKIIAAVVIGGGSLSGGRGSVVGTLTGAAIMLVIASGCTALGLRNPMQDIIIGVIIVAAVALDQLRQGRFLDG